MAKMAWKQFFKSHHHPAFRVLAGARFLERLLAGPSNGVCAEEVRKAGELIIEQGKAAESIYFVGQGNVSVYAFGPDRQEIRLATLGKEDFFGELSLLGEGDRPRSATVKAETDCILLRIEATEFREALHQHPDVLSEVLLILSERLRRLAERVGEVAYQEVNKKLELMGTKLDAELKAMNASLTASQTVFEQTTVRAHELIMGTEKFWTRVSWFGGTAVVVISILASVAGFFGISNFYELKNRTDSAVTRLEKNLKEIEDARQASQDVIDLRDALLSGATIDILPRLLEGIKLYGSRSDMAGYSLTKSAKKLFGVALRSNDMAISTQIFISVYQKLTVGFPEIFEGASVTSATPQSFEPLRDVLRVAIDNQDEKKVSPRDVALAYYFTLLSMAVEPDDAEDSAKEYSNKLKEFKYFREKQEFDLTEAEKKDFDPISIISAVNFNDKITEKTKIEIVKNIESAWFVLVSI